MRSRRPCARRHGVAHTAAPVPSCVAIDWPSLLSPKVSLRRSLPPPAPPRRHQVRWRGAAAVAPKGLLFFLSAMATAVGMRVPVWAAGVTVWLGLTVGLSLRVSGVLYTFGCLV